MRCDDIFILKFREPSFQSTVLNTNPQIVKLGNFINLILRSQKNGLTRRWSRLPICLVKRTKGITFRGFKLYTVFNKLLSA